MRGAPPGAPRCCFIAIPSQRRLTAPDLLYSFHTFLRIQSTRSRRFFVNVFPIAPAHSRYIWFVLPIALLLVSVLLLLAATVRGSRGSRFEILPAGLKLSGDLYGRTIPWNQLRIEMARRVDLSNEPQLRPSSRRAGTALPGYQAGWFKLVNGEKALLYLTDRTKAVYVPTSADYSLLLSPGDPDAFVAALRSRAR